MKPEHLCIDPAIQSDANRAVGQLSGDQQEMVHRLASVLREVLLAGGTNSHEALESLKELDPKAKEALNVLQNIP